MALESGTQLGHYEVTDRLGTGGMGEVYRARDAKLGREVALKALPPALARDPERLARLEREARMLAALNHPNIAAIYGLEQSGDTRFLVLELVEGDTLADRLKRGAIRVEESLKLALQIAGALEAAHEKGVIHRDLKPANIKVTPDAKVKVLDFGLAKTFAGELPDASLSNSPTLSIEATRAGVVLGTPAYMSPEQARGRPVDKRTDIWAFGCVLTEMLTGQPAFPGEDANDVFASVLKTEPDWSGLPANLNPRLGELLERCLERDIKQRYHDVADVRVEIEKILADPRGVAVRPVAGAVRTPRSRLPWIVTATALVAVIASAAVGFLTPEPAPVFRPVIRFTDELPASSGVHLGQAFLAMSPTDDQFVYATAEGLYLRPMDEFEPRLIPGTEGDEISYPFFSPEGTWVGYWSARDRQLKRIRPDGGIPDFLAEADNPFGPFWGSNGSILYVQNPGLIMQVGENGGPASVLLDVEERVVGPKLLPDGDTTIFGVGQGSEREVVAWSQETGVRETLFAGAGGGARYLLSGHLVYPVGTDIVARTFDLETWAVGGPVTLIRDFLRRSENSASQFVVSESGSLIYLSGQGDFGPNTLSDADLRINVVLNWFEVLKERVPVNAAPWWQFWR